MPWQIMHLNRRKHELVGKLCDEIAIEIVLRLVESKSQFLINFYLLLLLFMFVRYFVFTLNVKM